MRSCRLVVSNMAAIRQQTIVATAAANTAALPSPIFAQFQPISDGLALSRSRTVRSCRLVVIWRQSSGSWPAAAAATPLPPDLLSPRFAHFYTILRVFGQGPCVAVGSWHAAAAAAAAAAASSLTEFCATTDNIAHSCAFPDKRPSRSSPVGLISRCWMDIHFPTPSRPFDRNLAYALFSPWTAPIHPSTQFAHPIPLHRWAFV